MIATDLVQYIVSKSRREVKILQRNPKVSNPSASNTQRNTFSGIYRESLR